MVRTHTSTVQISRRKGGKNGLGVVRTKVEGDSTTGVKGGVTLVVLVGRPCR